MDCLKISVRIILSGCLLFAAALVQATTILQVGTSELVNESELVFEGRVQDRWSANNGQVIVTYVRFEVVEVVKGEYGRETLTLQFMGGVVDGEGLVVAASNIPELGEHGVYFVESTTVEMVNPLYGWSQGQFIVEEQAADERVYTVARQPVTGFVDQASPPGTVIATTHALGVGTAGSVSAQALTLQQFKDQVRGLIVAQSEEGE